MNAVTWILLRRSRGLAAAAIIALSAAFTCGVATAQFRADDQPMVTPPAMPSPRPAVDPAPRFSEVYRRSGQPRIVLLWNREFTDAARTAMVDEEVTRESGKSSSSAMDKTTQGSSESATLKDSDETYDRNKTVRKRSRAAEEPTRRMNLAERHAVVLRRAFVSEMNREGVRFIDRALVMRTTAAAQHRTGGDPKLIETDALLKHGELLMEVLMVEDKDAAAGYGFDVSAKDLRGGHEVTSLYSRAIPTPKPQPPGAWVAGENGYEYRRPSAPTAPSPAEVGAALARDVMIALGGNLEPMNPTPRRQR